MDFLLSAFKFGVGVFLVVVAAMFMAASCQE